MGKEAWRGVAKSDMTDEATEVYKDYTKYLK